MDITNESENLHVKQFKAIFQLRAVPMSHQVTNSKQPLRICMGRLASVYPFHKPHSSRTTGALKFKQVLDSFNTKQQNMHLLTKVIQDKL
jgi:hypothetical protein